MSESPQAVFLSYASQDAEAAKSIADALRAAGVEVWFDQNELVGGDAWDAKIRKQIADCALFVPVISAHTQARREGYFRLEWKLAAQRTHMISDDTPFLLPVVIDATRDADARVPAEFKSVQWTRMPGGDATAAFCARVVKLLTAGEGDELAPAAAVPTAASAAPVRRKTPWVAYGWAAVGIVFALVYAVRPIWQDSKSTGEKPARPTSAPAETEAQRLVAKAREVLEQGDEMNRENYALAEELLKRAEAADVTDASAWALHAWLSADVYRYGLDRTEARLAQLQAQASRAASLAPDSLGAQLAVLRLQTATRAAVEDIAKRQSDLAEKFPDDPRVYRLYGLSHAKDSVTFKMLERGLARWPDDSRLQGDMLNSLLLGGRYAEASEFAERVTRGKTGARVLAAHVFIQLWWHGDAAAAAASVARWPAWFLGEDRGSGMATVTALMNRQPGQALEVLRRFPRDYIRDSFFTGPRAALAAWAYEAAGQAESAEAEWRVVVQVCDRELAANPTDAAALHWKAWALARLGDKAAGRQILRVLLQRRVSIEGLAQVAGGLAGLALVLDDPDEALRELGRLGTYDPMRTRPPSRALFEVNPLFDPLRSDPRFQALRDAAPAPANSPNPNGASAPNAPGPGASEGKSVAVLAFANLSDDKANEYFSDGISEELLNVLAKVPGLKVSARTSAFFFKGKNTPIPEIARQLGVAYVVEGSVRKAGDKVRITAQLIKAADGFHVWSDTFTRDLKDIFAVQDEIAGLIAKNLSLELGVASGAKPHATSPEAYQLYLQARQAWNLRTLEGHKLAESLLLRAIALEPGFAKAHAALCDVWTTAQRLNERLGAYAQRESAGLRKAIAKAEEAIQLDPNCAEAHAALGNAFGMAWRLEDATRSLRRAVELNPNYATAHQWLGRRLAESGDLPGAYASLSHAAELDPLSHRILDNASDFALLLGRFEEAMSLLQRAAVLNPASVQVRCKIAFLLWTSGRDAEAVAAARALVAETESENRDYRLCIAAVILGSTGHAGEAEQTLGRMAPYQDEHLTSLAYLGRHQKFFAHLDNLQLDGLHWFLFDPRLAAVRVSPEFKAWTTRVGAGGALARANDWMAANSRLNPSPKL